MIIEPSLVRGLIAAQFPHWADLPVEAAGASGTANAIYRLGAARAVRLPRTEGSAADAGAGLGTDGCGEWSAHGHTVDFCQVDLTGFHPTIAQHVALHDPARVLREIEAKRRILVRHARDPWPCHDLRDLASPYTGHPDFPARA